MAALTELIDFLDKASYLDEIISYFRDSRNPLVLRLLLDDENYADILTRKFFYSDREALLRDVEDFSLLDNRIRTVTQRMDCWFNCTSHSQPHMVDKIRFLLVYSGRCACHVDDTLYQLTAGDVCVIPAGVTFSHEGLGADCHLIHMLLSPDYLQRTLMGKLPHVGTLPTLFFQSILDPQRKTVQVIRSAEPDIVRSFLLRALFEEHKKQMFYREPLESYLVLFITELLRTFAVSAEANRYALSADNKRILDIRHYIELNSQTVTLAAAAAHFHFTPGYLSRFVTKTTGSSFTQLVKEARLQQASLLLLRTTMSITDIIEACGYQNTSYFYRIFQEKFSCTPAEYRQKNYGVQAGALITDNTLPK